MLLSHEAQWIKNIWFPFLFHGIYYISSRSFLADCHDFSPSFCTFFICQTLNMKSFIISDASTIHTHSWNIYIFTVKSWSYGMWRSGTFKYCLGIVFFVIYFYVYWTYVLLRNKQKMKNISVFFFPSEFRIFLRNA